MISGGGVIAMPAICILSSQGDSHYAYTVAMPNMNFVPDISDPAY